MRVLKVFAYGLAFLLLLPSVAAGFENGSVITHFHSEGVVLPNSSLSVTEQIIVEGSSASALNIFVRDFPTRYTDRTGHQKAISLHLMRVLRDNRDIRFSEKEFLGGKRVFVAAYDTQASSRTHSYVFVYSMGRLLRSDNDNIEELLWDVTGWGWTVPIEQATVDITSPSGTHITRASGYTSPYGNESGYLTMQQTGDNAISFSTLRQLQPSEGVSVGITWPAGPLVREPLFHPDLDSVSSSGLLFAYLACYLGFWIFLARNQEPKLGVVVPLFEPPDHTSPALMNYICSEFTDGAKRAFAATLTDMVVKKAMKIEKRQGVTYIAKIECKPSALNDEEKKILEKLFSIETELRVNDPLMSEALWRMRTDFSYTCDTYFKTNPAFVFASLLSFVVNGVFGYRYLLNGPETPLFIVAALLFNLFFWALPKPNTLSPCGLDLFRKIQGFKMYLLLAEKERLDMHSKMPEAQLPTFEKYLPYAIALGVENAWGSEFASAIQEEVYRDLDLGSPVWADWLDAYSSMMHL